MSLNGKKITLAVTASVALYKACDLVRLLKKSSAEVQVIMTSHAAEMISPQVFSSLSGQPVRVDMFGYDLSFEHLGPADDCDVLLVAPATANFLGKAASGIADDLVSTVYLAMSPARVIIAPAMNCRMYEHPAVQANIATLTERGNRVLETETGELACGDVGRGRLASLDAILTAVKRALAVQDLQGKRVVVTAGPTQEPIDPVRFISNRSSGTMGYYIAQEAAIRGAQVVLISGPVHLPVPSGVELVQVETADEMAQAALKSWKGADLFIGAAAVCDFRSVQQASSKLKKKSGRGLTLVLEQNPDIIASITAARKVGQVVVGFALETDDLLKNAQAKLTAKKLDLIVANGVSSIGGSRGQAVILDAQGGKKVISETHKALLARSIIDAALEILPKGKR